MKVSKHVKNTIVFLSIVLIYAFITCLSNHWNSYSNFQIWRIDGDPFWDFSMTSKIASGFLPYKEINTIINPLFFYIGSAFLHLFGNNGYAFHLYNGFIYGSTLYLIYLILKTLEISKSTIFPTLITYALASIICLVTNYNHLAICFALLLCYLEICHLNDKNVFIKVHSKTRNILIGLLLILIFLTKQNIGCYFGIAYFIYLFFTEKQLPIKEKLTSFLYKCIGALIGLVPFLVYFTINNLWPYYYDLCIAGLKDFQANCSHTDVISSIICFFAIHMIYCCIKVFKQTNNKEILLIGMFLMASILFLYPILDMNHIITIIPFVIIAFVLLLHNNIYFQETYNYYLMHYQIMKPYIFISSFICIVGIIVLLVVSAYFPSVPEKYSVYKGYLALNDSFFLQLDTMNNYISEKEKEGYTIFFIAPDATLYRWPLGINNNKKDLFMHGNVGKTGYEDTLNEILSCPKPLVIYNSYEICWQEFESLNDFFKDYFTRIDFISNHFIYIKNQ